MSENPNFDTELIYNIIAAEGRKDAQKKINRRLKQVIVFRVVVPVVLVGVAGYVAGRLEKASNDQ